MSDDEGPKLTLAVSNPDRDIAGRSLLDDIAWPTRELAANMLRVARGAGKPEELIDQVFHLARTIGEAGKVSNAWGIWNEMQIGLQSIFHDKPSSHPMTDARNTVVSGALQVAASRLVCQFPQECRGSSEIDDGVEAMERVREGYRRKWAEEAEAARKARTPKPRLRKPATSAKKATEGRQPAASDLPADPAPKAKSTADIMRINARRLREGKEPI